MQRFQEQLIKFLFPVDSDLWLALLRLGLGLQVIIYTLSLRNDWNYFFAGTGHGLTGRDLSEAVFSAESSLVPRLGWLVNVSSPLGIGEPTMLSLTWVVLLAAGCGLLIGFFSRSAAIISWFLHLCATKSGQLFPYGMDNFMTIGLFYLMVSPLPDRYSFDQIFRERSGKNPALLGFFRRILQLHLCLIYFFAGITKCLGVGWWNGANMWRALTRPPFNTIPPDVIVRFKFLLLVAGILVCLTEIGYPIFIWFRRTRWIWLSAAVTMHAAIGLMMGMYLFALVMIVLNIAAFGPGLISFSGKHYAARGAGLLDQGEPRTDE